MHVWTCTSISTHMCINLFVFVSVNICEYETAYVNMCLHDVSYKKRQKKYQQLYIEFPKKTFLFSLFLVLFYSCFSDFSIRCGYFCKIPYNVWTIMERKCLCLTFEKSQNVCNADSRVPWLHPRQFLNPTLEDVESGNDSLPPFLSGIQCILYRVFHVRWFCRVTQ